MAGPSWPLEYTYGDRICVIGPSGSGKTSALISLCRQKSNVVVLDTKQDDKDPWHKVGVATEKLTGLREGRYVWKASKDFITDADFQSRTFESLLASGPRVVAIDEGYSVFPTRGARLFATQARGKRVAFIFGTQRPCAVPLFFITDANYWIIFCLFSDDDRKRVEKSIGRGKIDWETLRKEEWSFMIFDARGRVAGPYRLPDPNKGALTVAPASVM
jgi:hypothetical protein